MSAGRYVRELRPRVLRRPARWVAVLAAAALLLAGCGAVPGAAVVVDGTSVPEHTVQDRTQAFIAENVQDSSQTIDPVTRALFNQFQATDVVRHQLVLAAAKSQHIDVSTEAVTSFIAKNGGATQIAQQLSVPSDAVREAIYDYLVLQQLTDQLPASGVDVTDITVTVDVVPAANRDAAVAARSKYLKDPAAMDADAAAARATGQIPGGQESLLADAQDAMVGIFSAPQGQIVLIPEQAPTYYVVRVTKRSEKPAKLTKKMVQSAQSLPAQLVLSSLLLPRYAPVKDVMVNPRFGQWDPQTLQVIAGNNGL